MELTPSAPMYCIECGKPAYIPMAADPRCTNLECKYFDPETRTRWLKEDDSNE